MTSNVDVKLGISEGDQEDSFQNATLQGAGELVAFSIATFISIPSDVAEKGEATIAAFIESTLLQATQSTGGKLKFSVQIGPSLAAEGDDDE
jgi:hypothetical protein